MAPCGSPCTNTNTGSEVASTIGRITTGGSVTEFTIPTTGADPTAITPAPDGALWFTESQADKIGRITTAGSVTEFQHHHRRLGSIGITAGPDGALWFTETGTNSIGRITTAGSVTEFNLPTSDAVPGEHHGRPGRRPLVHRRLAFTRAAPTNKIGRITTSGTVTEFTVPTSYPGLTSITAGPDDALWFTETFGNKIGRISTGGSVTEFAVPTSNASPYGITAGPDGALWFTETGANKIGRISTGGSVTELNGPTSNAGLSGITLGPDGALWFTETESFIGNLGTGKIGRLGVGAGTGGNPSTFPLGANFAGSGTPVVNLNNNGSLVRDADPFPSFGGDVRRATGVLPNGDQLVVWAAGPGGGPDVQVVDATTGRVLADFFAFAPSFTGGVFVAVADVNGDGTPDIIVGAGAGGGPEVKVIDGTKLNQVNEQGEIENTALLADFFAYAPTFTGGVTVAAADFTGDGKADVVTGAGPGGGPEVKVIEAARLNQVNAQGEIEDTALLADFFAYAPNFAGGVFVAAGDVNGDGVPDLITGAGAGGGSEVKVIDGTKLGEVVAGGQPQAGPSQAGEIMDAALLGDFLAYAPGFTGGVRVDAVDVNGDGKADVVTGAGPGGGAEVKVVDATKLSAVVPQGQPQAGEIENAALLDDFLAQPNDPNGVFV